MMMDFNIMKRLDGGPLTKCLSGGGAAAAGGGYR